MMPVIVPPVVLFSLLNTENQQGHADTRQDDATPIEGMAVGFESRHITDSQPQPDDGNRDVDEEDPLPAQGVNKDAAEHRTDETRDTGSGSPQAHGSTALLRWEKSGNHRQRLWGHKGSSDALNRPSSDEDANRRGQTTCQ